MMTFFVVGFFFFFNYPQEEGGRVLSVLKREMGGENIRDRTLSYREKKKKYSKKVQYDFNEANICGCLWVMVCDFRVFLVDTIVWWWDSTPQQPSRD